MITRCTLLIYLSLVSLFAAAQRVQISGRLKESSVQSMSFGRIILNDTLQKFSKAYLASPEPGEGAKFLEHYKEFSKLSQDTAYIARPDTMHRFSITADLKDSLIFKSYQHITQRHAVSDLIKKDSIEIILLKQPCLPYQNCDQPAEKLYVFIAEKISVNYARDTLYCDRFSMDSKFDASYKIIKNLYGDFKGDSIKFTAYDHYGVPAFSHHKYVLLFVSKYCGKLFHEKYQYFDVYPTTNGRWASPGDPRRFNSSDTSRVQIEKIPFGTLNFDKIIDGVYHNMTFTSPYFKIEGNCVEPIMGAYAEELFEIKKKTVLKARGFFSEKQ